MVDYRSVEQLQLKITKFLANVGYNYDHIGLIKWSQSMFSQL